VSRWRGLDHEKLFMQENGREPGTGFRGYSAIETNSQADAMRAFAFLVALLLVLWAVDAVVYDGRYTGEVYQSVHKQGQKLRAEVKTRLNTDKT
jgi:hypothetical protein